MDTDEPTHHDHSQMRQITLFFNNMITKSAMYLTINEQSVPMGSVLDLELGVTVIIPTVNTDHESIPYWLNHCTSAARFD